MEAIANTRRGYAVRAERAGDRAEIYRIRHEVYARELRQHPVNESGELRDALDAHNEYLVLERSGRVAGFVSITPPTAPSYSIDKYLKRSELPFRCGPDLFEVRILTVAPGHRRGPGALLLMRAALDRVRELGGSRIVIMGRRELADFYASCGLKSVGVGMRSGQVEYDVMLARVDALPAGEWSGSTGSEPRGGAGHCHHGGAFFEAIGTGFTDLSRREKVVNADVLDAWFPPSPGVLRSLGEHLEWVMRTSPPTQCEGFLSEVSARRAVPVECLVPGAGSSALIFLALTRWLTPSSRVLLLDPTYGEYAHVLQNVVGCTVDRFGLDPEAGFEPDLDRLASATRAGYDLVVLVNPNNPTGRHIGRRELVAMLASVDRRTRVWIDETYSEYAGPGESVESEAAASENVVVCKSLSKVYALSGARAAYLCGPAALAGELRRHTPPWAISLPGQVGAVEAMRDHAYYEKCWQATHALRGSLVERLRAEAGLNARAGVINCVMCPLPADGPTAAEVVGRCRESGVFLRDCATISPVFGDRTVRIAVRSEPEQDAIIRAVCAALRR